MRHFGALLLAKEKNAIIVAFLAALLPVFSIPTGFVAVIVTALLTLERGAKSGFWVLTWVALPSIAMLALRKVGLADLLLLRCFLAWGFALLLRRYKSWSIVLLAMTITVAVLLLLGMHFLFPDAIAWWQTQLTASATRMLHLMPAALQKFDVKTLSPGNMARVMAPFALGSIAFLAAGSLLLELIIARFWQKTIVSPKNLDIAFSAISPNWLFVILPLVLIGLSFLYPDKIDVFIPVAFFPLSIAGLSVLHFFAQTKKVIAVFLFVVYVGFILFPMLIVPILAVIAWADFIVNFRKKRVGVL